MAVANFRFVEVVGHRHGGSAPGRLREVVGHCHVVEGEIAHPERETVGPVVADLAVVHLQNGPFRPDAHHLVVVDHRIVDDGFIAGKLLKCLKMNAIRGVGDDGILDEVVLRALVDEDAVPLGVVGVEEGL